MSNHLTNVYQKLYVYENALYKIKSAKDGIEPSEIIKIAQDAWDETKKPEFEMKITLEQIEELYKFLQGEVPEGINMKPCPKLSERRAFDVIWFLQEWMGILPDNYERCVSCGSLYDIHDSGGYRKDRCYCDFCY